MTTKSTQLRGLFLAALMVVSAFAIPMSVSAEATGLSLSSTSVTAGTDVTVTVDDDDGDTPGMQAFIDVNGNSAYDQDEPAVTNTSYTGSTSGITVGALSTDDLSEGTYTVYAFENASVDNFTAAQGVSTELTVEAAAPSDESAPNLESALEFNPAGADDAANVELAFDENISGVNSATAYVDGAEQDGVTASVAGPPGRVVVTGLNDVTPNQELVVNVNASDDAGNSFHRNVTVQVTSDTFAAGDSPSTYEGSQVVYNAGASDAGVVVQQTDGTHVFSGSTDENSYLYVFDTDDRSTDVGYNFTTAGTTTTLALRSFDLNVDAPLTVTQNGRFTVDVSANAGGQAITARLVNGNDQVVETTSATLDGSGEGTVGFTPSETGNYTVEVVDVNTGVTVTSDTVSVAEAGERTVALNSSQNFDQRGDVVAIPISLSNAETATVKLGTAQANYVVYGNVTDVDGDGMVTLLVNTYDASANNSYGVFAAGDDEFALDESADNEGVSTPLDAGSYDLEAGVDGIGGNAQAIGTFTVQSRSTAEATTWVTPRGAAFSGTEDLNSIAQQSEVAAGDTTIVAVETSGIYGLLEETNVSSTDALELSIAQSERPRNRERQTIATDQVETIPDAENNTVYVVIDTSTVTTSAGTQVQAGQSYDVTFTVNGSSSLAADDQSVSTQFEVVEPSATIDTGDSETLNLPASENATVTGTSTLAPGSELSIQIRGENNEFIDTNQVAVQSGGTWSTSFDLSDAANGTAFTVRVRSPVTQSVDGTVVEDMTTETPTGTETPTETATPTQTETETASPTEADTPTEAEPTTESDGTVPGFGLTAALVALVAAALLAYRRD